MAQLCTKLDFITDDKVRILENILWLNTPVDASLINLGVVASPSICDEIDIDIDRNLEIYEVEPTEYDTKIYKYPSGWWHTPTYSEMYYILNSRPNASNLRTLGRVDIDGNGTYVNGCFLLPDDWVLPAGVTMTITTADYTTNSYSLSEFESLENAGAVFLPRYYTRVGSVVNGSSVVYWISSGSRWFQFYDGYIGVNSWGTALSQGCNVRLCKQGIQFSTSATTKIDFAPANLQYHCTQHIWRFAEHSYDFIGADNANISDNYDGWIDLFGYGTSGVNFSPTLHTTDNADYASGDISGTENDWGINEIEVPEGITLPYDTNREYDKEKLNLIYSE